MAKLYWRVKRNNKWTWRPVVTEVDDGMDDVIWQLTDYYRLILPVEEEE